MREGRVQSNCKEYSVSNRKEGEGREEERKEGGREKGGMRGVDM